MTVIFYTEILREMFIAFLFGAINFISYDLLSRVGNQTLCHTNVINASNFTTITEHLDRFAYNTRTIHNPDTEE